MSPASWGTLIRPLPITRTRAISIQATMSSAMTLDFNQLWRGYIDPAIEELDAACGLNPSYLQAPSSHIMALHNSDRISPEEIAVAIREWGARFSLEHPASTSSTVLPGTDHPERLRVGFISGDFREATARRLARALRALQVALELYPSQRCGSLNTILKVLPSPLRGSYSNIARLSWHSSRAMNNPSPVPPFRPVKKGSKMRSIA
jgi:hypothetical protein